MSKSICYRKHYVMISRGLLVKHGRTFAILAFEHRFGACDILLRHTPVIFVWQCHFHALWFRA